MYLVYKLVRRSELERRIQKKKQKQKQDYFEVTSAKAENFERMRTKKCTAVVIPIKLERIYIFLNIICFVLDFSVLTSPDKKHFFFFSF